MLAALVLKQKNSVTSLAPAMKWRAFKTRNYQFLLDLMGGLLHTNHLMVTHTCMIDLKYVNLHPLIKNTGQ
jgi:hypothetical protein